MFSETATLSSLKMSAMGVAYCLLLWVAFSIGLVSADALKQVGILCVAHAVKLRILKG
jgi:hypothetical protein